MAERENFRDQIAHNAIGRGEEVTNATPVTNVPKEVFHRLLSLADNVYNLGSRPNREMTPRSTYDINRDITTDYEVAEPKLEIFTLDNNVGSRMGKNLYVSIRYRNIANEVVTANFPIGYDLPDGTLAISNSRFGLDKGHFELKPIEAEFLKAEFEKILGKQT